MSRRFILKYRTTVVISGIIVFLVFYVISKFSSYHGFRASAFGLHRGPPTTSEVPVKGQPTVFYVWCGSSRRPFEFRNYLSVRSAVRVLRPANVWFYYESEPQIDDYLYNIWWQELIDEVPFFHRRSLKDVGGQLPGTACHGLGRPSVDFVHDLVSSRGGIFVDESTVLVARPPDDGVTVALDIRNQSDVRLRLLKEDRGTSFGVVSSNISSKRSPPVVRIFNCSSDSELIDAKTTLCVHIAQSVYPKDIWTLDSDIGRILRYEFYGQRDIIKPIPSFDRLAPNIGHMIWLGGGQMRFMFFCGVLSLLHVAKVDMVYIYSDKPLTGRYWDLLVNTGQKVQFVLRENAEEVGLQLMLHIHLNFVTDKGQNSLHQFSHSNSVTSRAGLSPSAALFPEQRAPKAR